MKTIGLTFITFLLLGCSSKVTSIHPEILPITESVYASGYIKAYNQYTAYPKVNGVVEHVYVSAGDEVVKGSPLISIDNDKQKLNSETAKLTATFYDYSSNIEKLNELKNLIDVAYSKVKYDSTQYFRQVSLNNKGVGTPVDLERAEIAYKNSKSNYLSAITQYKEFKRQLDFNYKQSIKNLNLAEESLKDYTVFSEIDGRVYSIDLEKGDMVTLQSPVAVLGDKSKFILEIQIDEKDILNIKNNQKIVVTLDSYGDQSFMAHVTKIHPLMDIKSRSFTVEAEFDEQPEVLYPNLNFQANVIIATKDKALLIPRECMVNDSSVVLLNGDTVSVKTGLKDFKKIEILEGLTEKDEIIKP